MWQQRLLRGLQSPILVDKGVEQSLKFTYISKNLMKDWTVTQWGKISESFMLDLNVGT